MAEMMGYDGEGYVAAAKKGDFILFTSGFKQVLLLYRGLLLDQQFELLFPFSTLNVHSKSISDRRIKQKLPGRSEMYISTTSFAGKQSAISAVVAALHVVPFSGVS